MRKHIAKLPPFIAQLILGLVLFGVAFVGVAADLELPTIAENRIVFLNGKVLELESQLRVDSPSSSRISERATFHQQALLVKDWRRVLIIETRDLYEGAIQRLSVSDFEGNVLSEPRTFEGEAIILQKVGRVFLAQKSSHRTIKNSQILDMDGKLLCKVGQSTNVIGFEVAPDEQFVWIISSHLKDGMPFVKAVAISLANGKAVGELSSFHEGEKELIINGARYSVKIPEPQIPG